MINSRGGPEELKLTSVPHMCAHSLAHMDTDSHPCKIRLEEQVSVKNSEHAKYRTEGYF